MAGVEKLTDFFDYNAINILIVSDSLLITRLHVIGSGHPFPERKARERETSGAQASAAVISKQMTLSGFDMLQGRMTLP